MTLVEAAEKIIAQGKCEGVCCSECPAGRGESEHNKCTEKIGGAKEGGSFHDKDRALRWFRAWLAKNGHATPTAGEKPGGRFEVGHWYKWVGPKERQDGWNSEGKMDFILDGKPHQVRASDGSTWADFVDHPRGQGPSDTWEWYGLSNFRRVPFHGVSGAPRLPGDPIPTPATRRAIRARLLSL